MLEARRLVGGGDAGRAPVLGGCGSGVSRDGWASTGWRCGGDGYSCRGSGLDLR